ncbi:MAG: hypothetical protein A2Z88_06675 [Omnitrophica WOR_2 bacterium GWA2_47_8]|nr:MAG: hypothetical protein A2Z88_06675 [Omnitrophica WOR_2 bacterium GWA2_47_8]
MKENFKNILVVRTDRVGDVILTTPSLSGLRKAYPKAKITVLVSPLTRELIEGNPFIDEVLIDDRFKEHKSFVGFWQLVGMLRRKRFDLAIVFHTKKRANALCFLAGIPRRIGYRNNKFGFLLTDQVKDERRWGLKHEAEYCLDILKHMGINEKDLNFYIPVNRQAEDWFKELQRAHHITDKEKFFLIHAGASDPCRLWPAKQYSQLIEQLNRQYHYKVILIGDEGARAISDEIKQLTSIPLIDLVGKTSLSQLASLIRRTFILISNDSGPVHMGSALGCAVVAIFIRTLPGVNPVRWRPLGPRARVVEPSEEGQILSSVSGHNPPGMEVVKVSQVLEAVDGIFKLC